MGYFDFQEDARMGLLGGGARTYHQRRFRFGRRSPQFKMRQSEADAANRREDARAAQMIEAEYAKAESRRAS